jgi:hypothetical protein
MSHLHGVLHFFGDDLWILSPTSAACIGTSDGYLIDFPPIWVVLFLSFAIYLGWQNGVMQ